MKILQVVTLVSPDFAYGGPLRVALNQSHCLQDNGHEVTLLAMQRAIESSSALLDGIEVKLFPARHVPLSPPFAGLLSATMLLWFSRHHKEYDVVHVHLAREIQVAGLARIRAGNGPLVIQTHGMVIRDARLLSRLIDRSVLETTLSLADSVLYLTGQERRELTQVASRGAKLTHLANGVPVSPASEPATESEVLFMARLHPRKNPAVFAQAALTLAEKYPQTRFSILGPDGGEASSVEALLRAAPSTSVRMGGAVPAEKTADRLRKCAIYVLPSVEEPFPMSVLEAMAVARPVIVTHTNGLADLIEQTRSGLVVAPTVDAVRSAIDQLLSNPTEAVEMGRRAQQVIRTRLSIDVMGSKLLEIYRSATKAQGPLTGAPSAF